MRPSDPFPTHLGKLLGSHCFRAPISYEKVGELWRGGRLVPLLRHHFCHRALPSALTVDTSYSVVSFPYCIYIITYEEENVNPFFKKNKKFFLNVCSSTPGRGRPVRRERMFVFIEKKKESMQLFLQAT